MAEPYVSDPDFSLYVGDVRQVLAGLPPESVHCVVTSPPYFGLRDYAAVGQLGLEESPGAYIEAMVGVFHQVRRVMRSDGVAFVNMGDSYLPGKQLAGIPWRLAFALQADGWCLRADIIWSKPNPMPESVTDRPTKAHEYVFLLTKSPRYFFDQEAVREPHGSTWIGRDPVVNLKANGNRNDAGAMATTGNLSGRNLRSVWEIATQPYPEAHFATYPEALVERCLKAGCPVGGTVLDPFLGSGTTALVARRLGRRCVGVELSPKYAKLAATRLSQLSLLAVEHG